MRRIVIIGGVAAGMSAASKIRRMDTEAIITVFEMGDYVSYGACGLPYYVSGVTPSHEQMLIRTPEQFRESGIDVKIRHQVMRVFPQDHHVLVKDLTTDKLEVVYYDQLLIATGASPIRPQFMQARSDNIFTLKSIPDGMRMKAFFQDPAIREVAIIGAGYIGMELAESMHEMNKKVIIIELQPQILPQFDTEMTDVVRTSLETSGIRFHTGEHVQQFLTESNRVTQIETDKGKYPVDAVIVNVGVKPNTEFLKNSGIQLWENGAVLIDEYMQTSIPDIYAAGDCATSNHRVLQRPVHIALGTIANKQGRLAAENMMGEQRAFPGVLGTSVAKILDWTVAKTGIAEKEAKRFGIPYKTVTVKASSHASYYPNPQPIHIKLVYDPETHVLLGAQMVGIEGVSKRIDVFATAITNQMTTEEIGLLDLSYAPPYASVWDAVHIAANAAK